MEVILREDVKDVGKAGQIVKVKAGFGRNYLLPQGLAYAATPGNKKRVEAEARARGERLVAEKTGAQELAARLETLELTFQANVGEADKLFGSITTADIAGKLKEAGFAIDKRHVELDEPLKMIGVFKVPVRLHPEVRPEVKVWVVKAE